MTPPFISRQDLTDYLGRDVTADDGALIAVDAACDMVRSLAEQTFNAGTATETYDGTGTASLLLRQSPVLNAGTVLVNGGTVTDYVLDENRGILVREIDTTNDWWNWDWASFPTVRWPEGRQNVEVTYEHGYSDDDLPRDVRMVALSIASRLIVQGPAMFETAGPDSVRYGVNSTDLTNGEKMVLAKYRQIH